MDRPSRDASGDGGNVNARASASGRGGELFEALLGSNPELNDHDLFSTSDGDVRAKQERRMQELRMQRVEERVTQRIGNVNMLADHQLWNRGTSSEQVPVVAKPTPTRASAPAQQEPGPALTPAQRRMGVRRQSVLRLEKCQQLPLVPEGEADKPPHTACSYEGGATGTVPHLAGFAGGLPTQPATGEGALALPADAASGKLANSAVAPPDGAQLARSDSFEFGELAQYNPVRRACVRLVCNPDFELAVTLLIFANCVSLCLYDPLQPDNSTHNRTLFWIELGMNIAYTLEMFIRVISVGSFRVYLSRPWNQFDFTMVLIGYISVLPIGGGDTSGVRALRALRALRILRTITRFESLRAVVVCFLEAVPLLSAALFLVFALLFLYAVAAVQMFTPVYFFICTNPETGAYEVSSEDPDMFGCSGPEKVDWYYRYCPADFDTCVNTGSTTAVNVPGFANVGLAFLTNFQIMTLTGWSYIMFRTIDNTSPFAGIYFITLLVLSAYCLINLFIAVLKTKFAKAQTQYEANFARRKKNKKKNTLQIFFSSAKSQISSFASSKGHSSMLSSKLASDIKRSISKDDSAVQDSPRIGVDADLVVQPAPGHPFSKAPGAASHPEPTEADDCDRRISDGADDTSSFGGSRQQTTDDFSDVHRQASVFRVDRVPRRSALRLPGQSKKGVVMGADGPVLRHMRFDEAVLTQDPDDHDDLSRLGSGDMPDEGQDARYARKGNEYNGDDSYGDGILDADVLSKRKTLLAGDDVKGGVMIGTSILYPDGTVGPGIPVDANVAMDLMDKHEFDEFVSDMPLWARLWLMAKFRARKLVMQPSFDRFFLFLIAINTVFLAMDYDGASDAYVMVLWYANLALTGFFTLEVGLKLFGLGFWEFVRDGWNLFDTLVVVVSYVEIILVTILGNDSGVAALRILRALRVLRLFKLFKYLESLQRIAAVLMASFGSFISIMVLLVLFWLVFTIMGMHVFGGEVLSPYPWPNYDTFLQSLVSTFNILNLENYQNQMGGVVRATNWGASLFFVTWIFIGKYICVALFLAVMLEAFEAKYDPGLTAMGTGTRASLMSGQSSNTSLASLIRSSHQSDKLSPPASPRRADAPAAPRPGTPPRTSGRKGKGGAKVQPVAEAREAQPSPGTMVALGGGGACGIGRWRVGRAGPVAEGQESDDDALLDSALRSLQYTKPTTTDGRPSPEPWSESQAQVKDLDAALEELMQLQDKSKNAGALPGPGARLAPPVGAPDPLAAPAPPTGVHDQLVLQVPVAGAPPAGGRVGAESTLSEYQLDVGVVAGGRDSVGPPGAAFATPTPAVTPLPAIPQGALASAQPAASDARMSLPPDGAAAAAAAAVPTHAESPATTAQQQPQPQPPPASPPMPLASGTPRAGSAGGRKLRQALAASAAVTLDAGAGSRFASPRSTAVVLQSSIDASVPQSSIDAAVLQSSIEAVVLQSSTDAAARSSMAVAMTTAIAGHAAAAASTAADAPRRSAELAVASGNASEYDYLLAGLVGRSDAKGGGAIDMAAAGDATPAAAATAAGAAGAAGAGGDVDSAGAAGVAGGREVDSMALALAGRHTGGVVAGLSANGRTHGGNAGTDANLMQPDSLEGDLHGKGAVSRSLSFRSDGSGPDSEGGNDKDRREEDFRTRQAKRNGAVPIEGSGKSYWLFDEDDPNRVWVYDIVVNKWFDYIFLVIILLNCVVMALEGPWYPPDSTFAQALYWSDVGFTVVFGLEVLVKSYAFTFSLYIRQIPNQLDFVIVVVSVLVLSLEKVLTNAAAIQALHALRAIKPLRMLSRSKGMRMVFRSLVLSLAAMGNVSVVLVMFFLLFAILGTQLFMGLLYSCNDTSVAGQTECVGEYLNAEGLLTPRVWSNAWPNFDNVGNSLLVCFLVVTLNGYTQVMYETMSAPSKKGEQPRFGDNPGAFFWYVGFVFIVAFALLNLYIGVIFSQFTRIRLAGQGSAFLTGDQQEWAELSKMVFKLRPAEKATPPKSGLRRACYFLATSSRFETLMMLIIVTNLGFLSAAHYGQSAYFTQLDTQMNYFFCAVFIFEAILKIYGLGWNAYWKDKWNRFDFFLALMCVVDLAASALALSFIRALRVLRAQRLLRLLRNSSLPKVKRFGENIRSLANVLLASIPGMANVMALIGLVIFIYAYIGVSLFGEVAWSVGINPHTNFFNFGNALLLLLRTATMDNWIDIMMDCMPQYNQACNPAVAGSCGSVVAIPYFVTYIIIVTIILINLFSAVIIEMFEKTHSQEDWKLSPQLLEQFVTLWGKFDDGSGTILPKDLEELLLELDPPLGLGPDASSKDVLRFVYDLDIPLVNGRVPFHKTAFELVKRVSQSNIPEGAVKEQMDKMADHFFKVLPSTDDMIDFSTSVVAARVQRVWRVRTRMLRFNRRCQWRAGRCAELAAFSELWLGRDELGERFRLLRDEEEEEAAACNAEGYGGSGQLVGAVSTAGQDAALLPKSRWCFNEDYIPDAASMDKKPVTKQVWSLLKGAVIGSNKPARKKSFEDVFG